jgi:hypothetical protein
MPKISVGLIAVLLAGGVGYLAYNPQAARDAANWLSRQFNIDRTDTKPMGTPNYMPVVPGR